VGRLELTSFFSHLANALTAQLAPALAGERAGACLTPPLRMARTVLERGLVDEAMEMGRQGLRHLRRSAGAGTLHQTLDPVMGKAMDPCAQRGIGQVEGVGDRLEALPCDDFADGLSAPKHAGLFRLLYERLSRGQGLIGKVECESPPGGGLQEQRRQCLATGSSSLLKQRFFDSNFSGAANYIGAIRNWVVQQQQADNIFCVVDLHALTVYQDPEILRAKIREDRWTAAGLWD
jgi:hypothetical protein